ncbi:MAG: hypothetical protein U0Y82_03560 [Thermoleophilia bacterium]
MKGYRTKKIALPGGRVIEIVYFAEPNGDDPDTSAPEAASPDAAHHHHTQGLHVCEACGGDLVYPVAWEERDGDRWRIERRCPDCEWRDTSEFHQSEVELFDDVLNEGTEDLLVSLRNFARTNMEEDIERLIEAIHMDLIQPMDF